MLSWTVLLPCLILVALLRNLFSAPSGITAPQPSRPFWDIFNLKLLFAYLQAGRRGTLHAFQRALLASTSQVAGFNVKTISYAKPGSQRIFTVDCINIHALLATQFGDFDTGMRKHWFGPLLGVHSIVCFASCVAFKGTADQEHSSAPMAINGNIAAGSSERYSHVSMSVI